MADKLPINTDVLRKIFKDVPYKNPDSLKCPICSLRYAHAELKSYSDGDDHFIIQFECNLKITYRYKQNEWFYNGDCKNAATLALTNIAIQLSKPIKDNKPSRFVKLTDVPDDSNIIDPDIPF